MATDAQLRATKKYQKEKTKSVAIRFMPADMDIYEYLNSKDNKAGYIKDLIRRDMEGSS